MTPYMVPQILGGVTFEHRVRSKIWAQPDMPDHLGLSFQNKNNYDCISMYADYWLVENSHTTLVKLFLYRTN